MAYQLEWYLPNGVIYVTYSGTLTDNDIIAANAHMLPFLNQSAKPLHTLVNVTGLKELAVNFAQVIKNEAVAGVSAHKNLGWVLYFDKSNPIYVFMASVNAQTHDERMRFFDTEAEAVSFLQGLGDISAVQPSERLFIAASEQNITP